MPKLLFLFCLIANTQIYSQHSETVRLEKIVRETKPKAPYVPNTIIIKLKPQIFKNKKEEQRGAYQVKLASAKVSSIKIKYPSTLNRMGTNRSQKALNFPSEENFGLANIYELKYEGTKGIQEIINEILRDSNVIYAEPNYIYHPLYIPNDPSLNDSKQPYLNQVKANQGWDIVRDASDIIIAIIDSGTDLIHEDLKENIYLNKRDPINGIDDDNDGFIDNYYGWDFVREKTNSII